MATSGRGAGIIMGKVMASNGEGFSGVSNVSGAGSFRGLRAFAGKT
jgi:hypothetical protein